MFSSIFNAADLLKRQGPVLGFAGAASSPVGVGDGAIAAPGGAFFNPFFDRLTPPGGHLT
jgi:hypothetical protein